MTVAAGYRSGVGPRPPGDERIILPIGAESPGRARRWMALLAAGVGSDRLTDALLIVSELVSISVRHAGPAAEWLELSAEVWPDRIRVTIHDTGWVSLRRREDRPGDDENAGILLALALADRLEFDAALREVRFEIHL